MTQSQTRIPLDSSEIVLFTEPQLTSDACRKLLTFFRAFQEKNLAFFLSIRERWHAQNPGEFFPGLCANINPITGQFRGAAEQRLWGWGDGRALGTWSAFLARGAIPAKQVLLDVSPDRQKKVDLRQAMSEYVDIIYRGLKERRRANNGLIPFTADYHTNLVDDNPRNSAFAKGEIGFSNLFTINGFIQYGIFRNSKESLEIGLQMLDEAKCAIGEGRFRAGHKTDLAEVSDHGPRMILLGVIGDVLATIHDLELKGNRDYSGHTEPLVAGALTYIEYILEQHYREDPPAFWEQGNRQGGPAPNESGQVVVDPGHATEFAGFLAELAPFLPESWKGAQWTRDRVVQAALAIHLFADAIGFAESGVMIKHVDLNTGAFLPDTQAGKDFPTAPWWNVREHCAAALSLYLLTQDTRLLESYRKAQHASYLHYPNKRIGGQMIQMVAPFSLEPLDVAPSTGNLDPMHDARSRAREIEALETVLERGA